MLITPEEISHITGAPLKNTKKYWPIFVDELTKLGKNKIFFQVAILATIGVEQGQFTPTKEWYPPSWSLERAKKYFNDAYSNRKDLGNNGGDSGWNYRGRGFFQLTGMHNYRKYGQKIGVDLIKDPDLALDPVNSIKIAVLFAIDHGLDVWAKRAYDPTDEFEDEEAWRQVRRKVNGGLTHYDKFRKMVTLFKEAASQEGTNV